MKIAMITPWAVKCGIFTYSRNLSNALAKLDNEIYVVRLPRYGHRPVNVYENVVKNIPSTVDLIHVQHEYGLYLDYENQFFRLLKTLNKPIVTTVHAVGNWVTDDLITKVSNSVILHNEYCKKKFTKSDKVSIIPHGVEIAAPTEKSFARQVLGIDPKQVVVGYVGFISTYKGIEVLIEAMSKVPDALLMICGGWHSEREEMSEYIESLKIMSNELMGERCQWLGYIPDQKLPLVYGVIDLIVYPSRYSSESGALLMAMGYGKPVIASDVPPFKEKKDKGALVTFKDKEDLVEKINKFIKDIPFRKFLENGSKVYTMENSWGTIAGKHAELYKSLI